GRVRVAVDAVGSMPEVEGVEAELRAMLQALVVNAVEASPDGDEVGVRVLSPEGGTGVRVEIRDRGPGLAEEVRKRLFTPHVSTKASGSGMGLFLAHRLATERYGGSLELFDRDGGGTLALLEINGRVDTEGVEDPLDSSHVTAEESKP
ncbi:MAG: ATP-binding protein, partial [Thermoanaerobaculia bacterium]|nr:ATP-binding protein [Thermoanaerobaculia bacterium]